MGYMAVVRVARAGEGVTDCKPGDRLLTSTGHASHAILPASPLTRVWPLPEEFPAQQAVFARMAKTAATALTTAGVTFGQSVAVLGLGIIGQVCLRLFRAAGAQPIVGLDPVAARREAARRGGAVPIVPGDTATFGGVLPHGADIVVDATGWAESLPAAMALAAEGGRVVVLGSPRGRAADVDFYTDLHRRSLKVLGAHDSGIGNHPRERFPWTNDRVVPTVIELVRDGRLPVADLITHHVPAGRLPEMYAGLLDRKEEFLGVVLDWTGRP
jgi:threonine dehydrogenase-like Zn-dependent dehydrogenase